MTGSTGATALIVDDSLVIRAVTRAVLEAEGYLVVEAEDGMSALAQCPDINPDVILLDIEMPGLDGYQVLAKLKADIALRDIPVVFLTDRTGMTDIVAGLRGGAHDYLKKPFEPQELLARVGSATHVKRLQDELRQRNAELDQTSRIDSLTGLYNRRHLEDELSRHAAASRRHPANLAVILFDIDHFKHVNDTYGHPAGDIVLREFAHRLTGELRAEDVAGRWGGEEFLVLLPHADDSATVLVAERIRRVIAAAPMDADGTKITVTVSGGCALGPAEKSEDLIHDADRRLYRAKSNGRDQIVAATTPARVEPEKDPGNWERT